MKGYLKKTEPACTYNGAIFVHNMLYNVPDAIKDKFKAFSKPKTTKPRKEKEETKSAELKVVENDG